ncbi:FAD-binding oxidoreductase [uncultured Shimia sp.]|uniref:NAD(P)/FAD-dependent oxidoreductase n=1 Tax=uncultured Shimia sp. TaxID=573152 RepID=UPI00263828A0|nr:FAD-binding oxidoreductase [uncultured Shimia sp.]
MPGFPITIANAVEHQGPLPPAADVVIIGGGVIGVCTAYFLAKRGLRPVLLEKGRIAGEQSSRNWGWIRQQGRDLDELPIANEANQLWGEIGADLDENIELERCGLTYFAEDAAEMERYEAWVRDAAPTGVDSRVLSVSELNTLIPGMADHKYLGGLHTPSDMKAEPWLAVPAIARAAVRHGAVFVENCAARILDRHGGRVSGVVTEQGTIAAPEVIVAGGAWSSLFLRNEGVKIPQLSVKATVAATNELPLVHAGGAVDRKLAFRRRSDGGYTLAAAGFHEMFVGWDAFRHLGHYLPQLKRDFRGRTYLPKAPAGYPDGWTTARHWGGGAETPFERMRILDPKPNAGKVEDIRKRFEALLPGVGSVNITATWAGMIDSMPDIVPVVDRAPIEGLSICTGMCGHGFGIGPGFGRIMADMVTGGDVGHDLTRFRFNRFTDGSKLSLGPDL